MKLGIIARADLTGLGVQSRNWVRLLDPHKVIVIDSTSFNGNEQHFEWYKDRNAVRVNGFIQPHEFDAILDGIDALLSFEIFYNYDLITVARRRGIKTILQNNWEFTDYIQRPYLPYPDLLINHSYWGLNKQKTLWPNISDYCPTPLFVEDYEDIEISNLKRKSEKRRFLHVAGRNAYKGRNGTQDLLEAMKLVPRDVDFELVVKVQTAQFDEVDDPRVVIDRNSPLDEKELYKDFDAMIFPRRYAGASLPMTEALASALPVVMTDIEPNNMILPAEWLVPAIKKDEFMARTLIDVYSADHKKLADKIVDFVYLSNFELNVHRTTAIKIAISEYSDKVVRERWAVLMKKLGV